MGCCFVISATFVFAINMQIYDRSTGEVVHEMLTLEGSAINDIELTKGKIIAMLAIREDEGDSNCKFLDREDF
jgi:hypothetical protein